MIRLVCLPCNAEMVWDRPVLVQLNALASNRDGGAYRQRRGDVAKCPACGKEVVGRFAESGWEHHDKREPEANPDVIVEERIGGRAVSRK